MHYFPSKKVVAVAIFALGVLVWVVYDSDSLKNLEYGLQAPFHVAENSSQFPDSDNDGLFDWEETLLGTNKNDFDSDNDGTADGEQYASLKNIPLIQPTDDVLNYLSQLGSAVTSNESQPPLPEARSVNIPNLYTKELYSLTASTPAMYEDYANSFVTILRFSYPEIVEGDMLETISLWVSTKNEDERLKIKETAKMLEYAAADLSLLATPSDLIELHLELLNNLHKESSYLKELFTVITSNPAQGFLASAGYTNYRSKRAASVLNIAEKLDLYLEEK